MSIATAGSSRGAGPNAIADRGATSACGSDQNPDYQLLSLRSTMASSVDIGFRLTSSKRLSQYACSLLFFSFARSCCRHQNVSLCSFSQYAFSALQFLATRKLIFDFSVPSFSGPFSRYDFAWRLASLMNPCRCFVPVVGATSSSNPASSKMSHSRKIFLTDDTSSYV